MSRRQERLKRQYFEELYAADADPWGFTTSSYERQKYAATLSATGSGHECVLEIGCSIGVFTRQLARTCRKLIATDIAEAALAAARRRCQGMGNIEFRRMELPRELPKERFDLVVMSEVGYYWTLSDLDRLLEWLRAALLPDGRFVLVHWTGLTDYPLTGDQVHDHIITQTDRFLRLESSAPTSEYRFDILARPGR